MQYKCSRKIIYHIFHETSLLHYFFHFLNNTFLFINTVTHHILIAVLSAGS